MRFIAGCFWCVKFYWGFSRLGRVVYWVYGIVVWFTFLVVIQRTISVGVKMSVMFDIWSSMDNWSCSW